jgi:hypothetical protein
MSSLLQISANATDRRAELAAPGLDAESEKTVWVRRLRPDASGTAPLPDSAPGWIYYLARVDGTPAAATTLCLVAATDPGLRGRRDQALLIARRLADGRAAGADLAAAETVEENASPRSFRRAGFGLVRRRWIERTDLPERW